MARGKFISYLRVSTDKQGRSGLGLEAQRKAVEDYLDGGRWELLAVSTNWAESYFSRLRRAEFGVHHCVRKQHLGAYAREMAWREDHRREPNGTQYLLVVAAALGHPVSREWKGNWQR